MGWAVGAGVVITSLNMYYADLPDYAYSYDGEERSISQFYDQKIPNIAVGGHYEINDNWYGTFNVNTGTHTDKINTFGLDLGIGYHQAIDSEWSYNIGLFTQSSFTKHKPCKDSYNREYLCTTLTAFSDIKDKSYEHSNEIRITFNRSW